MSSFESTPVLIHGDPAADQILRGPSGGCLGDLISAPDSGYYLSSISTNCFCGETYVLAGVLKSQDFKLCFGANRLLSR